MDKTKKYSDYIKFLELVGNLKVSIYVIILQFENIFTFKSSS